MEYLRRLLGRVRRQRHRLEVLQQAISPGGSVARLFVRAGIATRLRALGHRRAGYRRWIALFDELTPNDKEEIARRIAGGALPAINVIWALGPNDRSDDVARLVRSLQAQLLGAWTMTILVSEGNEEVVADDAVRSDPRLRLERRTKDGAWPDLPRENLLLLLSPGVFREHSLFTFAQAAASGAEVIYCDTDRIDGSGVRTSPAFRPGFSPTLARQTNCFGPCIYVRTSAQLAGIDIANELQVSRAIADCERATVMHVPLILFHQTVAREPAVEACESDDVVRSVSIIIPTRDRVELLRPCIDSIRARTDYPEASIEIVVVDNGSVETHTLDYLRELASGRGVQVIRDDGSFNYSRLNNLGARRTTGDVLVLLNNDIVIEDPRWLRRLVSCAVKPDVGAVGGKLLYPDRTVQHDGVILGVGAGARHAHLYQSENAPGYLGLALLDHETTAVTGACLAIRRELFEALGGLDESLAVSFNDVTLCAEAQRRGYRNVCIAHPLAIHFESKSRGFDDTAERVALARRELVDTVSRYRDLFRNDPYYSPNLSEDGTCGIAFPPRVARPWRVAARGDERKLRVVLLGEASLGVHVEEGLRAQAAALVARGHDVVIGSSAPKSATQLEGCRHVVLRAPDQAAEFAIRDGTDCVVVHSSPFFAVGRWLGAAARLVVVDHADAEADAPAVIVAHNRFWQAWADRVVTMEAGAGASVTVIEKLCMT